MVSHRRLRIVYGFIAGFCILFAAWVSYSNLASKRAIVGVTEDTPANNMRTLLLSLASYEIEYKRLPPSLSVLGPPPAGKGTSPEAAGFIDSRLASGTKNDYLYRYIPADSKSNSFTITADPIRSSKQSHYFADQTAVIRVESGHSAAATSTPYAADN